MTQTPSINTLSELDSRTKEDYGAEYKKPPQGRGFLAEVNERNRKLYEASGNPMDEVGSREPSFIEKLENDGMVDDSPYRNSFHTNESGMVTFDGFKEESRISPYTRQAMDFFKNADARGQLTLLRGSQDPLRMPSHLRLWYGDRDNVQYMAPDEKSLFLETHKWLIENDRWMNPFDYVERLHKAYETGAFSAGGMAFMNMSAALRVIPFGYGKMVEDMFMATADFLGVANDGDRDMGSMGHAWMMATRDISESGPMSKGQLNGDMDSMEKWFSEAVDLVGGIVPGLAAGGFVGWATKNPVHAKYAAALVMAASDSAGVYFDVYDDYKERESSEEEARSAALLGADVYMALSAALESWGMKGWWSKSKTAKELGLRAVISSLIREGGTEMLQEYAQDFTTMMFTPGDIKKKFASWLKAQEDGGNKQKISIGILGGAFGVGANIHSQWGMHKQFAEMDKKQRDFSMRTEKDRQVAAILSNAKDFVESNASQADAIHKGDSSRTAWGGIFGEDDPLDKTNYIERALVKEAIGKYFSALETETETPKQEQPDASSERKEIPVQQSGKDGGEKSDAESGDKEGEEKTLTYSYFDTESGEVFTNEVTADEAQRSRDTLQAIMEPQTEEDQETYDSLSEENKETTLSKIEALNELLASEEVQSATEESETKVEAKVEAEETKKPVEAPAEVAKKATPEEVVARDKKILLEAEGKNAKIVDESSAPKSKLGKKILSRIGQIRALHKKFGSGVRMVFYTGSNNPGLVTGARDTIFINVGQMKDRNGDVIASAVRQIWLHEFGHAKERTAAWKSLHKWAVANDPQYLKSAHSYWEVDSEHGRGAGVDYETWIKTEHGQQEAMATYLEDVSGDQKFWTRLAKSDPNLLVKIYRALSDFLERMSKGTSAEHFKALNHVKRFIEEAAYQESITLKEAKDSGAVSRAKPRAETVARYMTGVMSKKGKMKAIRSASAKYGISKEEAKSAWDEYKNNPKIRPDVLKGRHAAAAAMSRGYDEETNMSNRARTALENGFLRQGDAAKFARENGIKGVRVKHLIDVVSGEWHHHGTKKTVVHYFHPDEILAAREELEEAVSGDTATDRARLRDQAKYLDKTNRALIRTHMKSKSWKGWFRKSTLTFPDGTAWPLTHATNKAGFSVFDTKSTGLGSHFGMTTAQGNDIIAYAQREEDERKFVAVYHVYGRAENPIRLYDKDMQWSPRAVMEQLMDYHSEDGWSYADLHKFWGLDRGWENIPEAVQDVVRTRFQWTLETRGSETAGMIWRNMRPEARVNLMFGSIERSGNDMNIGSFQDYIKSKGYDSAIYVNRVEGLGGTGMHERYDALRKSRDDEAEKDQIYMDFGAGEAVILFDPEQIKTVWNNNPSESPDINRAINRDDSNQMRAASYMSLGAIPVSGLGGSKESRKNMVVDMSRVVSDQFMHRIANSEFSRDILPPTNQLHDSILAAIENSASRRSGELVASNIAEGGTRLFGWGMDVNNYGSFVPGRWFPEVGEFYDQRTTTPESYGENRFGNGPSAVFLNPMNIMEYSVDVYENISDATAEDMTDAYVSGLLGTLVHEVAHAHANLYTIGGAAIESDVEGLSLAQAFSRITGILMRSPEVRAATDVLSKNIKRHMDVVISDFSQNNPHATPDSLTDFSVRWFRKIGEAQQNYKDHIADPSIPAIKVDFHEKENTQRIGRNISDKGIIARTAKSLPEGDPTFVDINAEGIQSEPQADLRIRNNRNVGAKLGRGEAGLNPLRKQVFHKTTGVDDSGIDLRPNSAVMREDDPRKPFASRARHRDNDGKQIVVYRPKDDEGFFSPLVRVIDAGVASGAIPKKVYGKHFLEWVSKQPGIKSLITQEGRKKIKKLEVWKTKMDRNLKEGFAYEPADLGGQPMSAEAVKKYYRQELAKIESQYSFHDELFWSGLSGWIRRKGNKKIRATDIQKYIRDNELTVASFIEKADAEGSIVGSSNVQYRNFTLPGEKSGQGNIVITYRPKGNQPHPVDPLGPHAFYDLHKPREQYVLGWIRFSERSVVTSGGKTIKVFFVEEMQSDWFQKGRKKFGSAEVQQKAKRLKEIKKRIRKKMEEYSAKTARLQRDAVRRVTDNTEYSERQVTHAVESAQRKRDAGYKIFQDRIHRITAMYDAITGATTIGNVTSHPTGGPRGSAAAGPFQDRWQELFLRRAISYAVENGYENVGWTSGDQGAFNNMGGEIGPDGKFRITDNRLTEGMRTNYDKITRQAARDIMKPHGGKPEIANIKDLALAQQKQKTDDGIDRDVVVFGADNGRWYLEYYDDESHSRIPWTKKDFPNQQSAWQYLRIVEALHEDDDYIRVGHDRAAGWFLYEANGNETTLLGGTGMPLYFETGAQADAYLEREYPQEDIDEDELRREAREETTELAVYTYESKTEYLIHDIDGDVIEAVYGGEDGYHNEDPDEIVKEMREEYVDEMKDAYSDAIVEKSTPDMLGNDVWESVKLLRVLNPSEHSPATDFNSSEQALDWLRQEGLTRKSASGEIPNHGYRIRTELREEEWEDVEDDIEEKAEDDIGYKKEYYYVVWLNDDVERVETEQEAQAKVDAAIAEDSEHRFQELLAEAEENAPFAAQYRELIRNPNDAPTNLEMTREQQTPSYMHLMQLPPGMIETVSKEGIARALHRTKDGNYEFRTSWAKKSLTSTGNLPPDVYEAHVRNDGFARQQIHLATRAAARLDKAMKGSRDIQPELINDVLRGAQPESVLPDTIRTEVRNLRTHIDALSSRLMRIGAVEGEMKAIVEKNKGTYLTQAYRVFDDPKWAKKIPKDVMRRAKAWMRVEMPYLSGAQINQKINQWLYEGTAADGPIRLLSKGGKLGQKDLTILRRRKGLAPEIQALFGKYADPAVNYIRSITKMSHLIASHQFLTEVRAKGLGKFLFLKTDKKIPDWATHTISQTDPSTKRKNTRPGTMAPLEGLLTHPDVAAAFEDALDQSAKYLPAWLRTFLSANVAVKYSKTILSPLTHERNLIGNVMFATFAGHWRFWKVGRAVAATVGDSPMARVFGLDRDGWNKYHSFLLKLGVIDDSASAGELNAAIKDLMGAEGRLRLKGKGPLTKAGAAVGNAITWTGHGIADISTALYLAEDNVWKVYAFENELARYRRGHPEWSETKLYEKAAHNVRMTYPTYSLVPKAIKALRYIPFVGTFTSFAAEVPRTHYNTLKLIFEEFHDPKMRGAAIARMVGITAGYLSLYAATKAARYALEIDDDEDDAARRLMADWYQDSEIIYRKKEDGKLEFINLSYHDPHAMLKESIYGILNGEDWFSVEGKFVRALKPLITPFLGEEILFGKFMDVIRNTNGVGGKVFNTNESALQQTTDIGFHIWDAFEPGLMTEVRRAFRTGDAVDNVMVAAWSGGFRKVEMNVARALSFRVNRYNKDVRDVTYIITKEAQKPNEKWDAGWFSTALGGAVSKKTLKTAYSRSEEGRRRIFDRLVGDIAAARTLGVTESQIRMIIRKGPISEENTDMLMRGVYKPYIPSEKFLQQRIGRASAIEGPGVDADEIVKKLTRRKDYLIELSEERVFAPETDIEIKRAYLSKLKNRATKKRPSRHKREKSIDYKVRLKDWIRNRKIAREAYLKYR